MDSFHTADVPTKSNIPIGIPGKYAEIEEHVSNHITAFNIQEF